MMDSTPGSREASFMTLFLPSEIPNQPLGDEPLSSSPENEAVLSWILEFTQWQQSSERKVPVARNRQHKDDTRPVEELSRLAERFCRLHMNTTTVNGLCSKALKGELETLQVDEYLPVWVRKQNACILVYWPGKFTRLVLIL
ncbi:unnamed protein product [Amoebophrya sp. A25]|nr:unnamed protein product [Amoebophrya sp. A25]|eukprot:GSA25T00014341001.1